MDAYGWNCYTSKGDTAADVLATCLCETAAKYFKDLRMTFRADLPEWLEPKWSF